MSPIRLRFGNDARKRFDVADAKREDELRALAAQLTEAEVDTELATLRSALGGESAAERPRRGHESEEGKRAAPPERAVAAGARQGAPPKRDAMVVLSYWPSTTVDMTLELSVPDHAASRLSRR